MTFEDLPAAPANTRWLTPSETVQETDYLLNHNILRRVPGNLAGVPAGEPQGVSGAFTHFARNLIQDV